MVVPQPLTNEPQPCRLDGHYLSPELLLFETVGAYNLATALNAQLSHHGSWVPAPQPTPHKLNSSYVTPCSPCTVAERWSLSTYHGRLMTILANKSCFAPVKGRLLKIFERWMLLSRRAVPFYRTTIKDRQRIGLNASEYGGPGCVSLRVTGHSFIPAAACHLVRDDKHHELVCGCVEI
ncbi:hypothetical protein PF1751_v1c24880 [Pseudomonas simiae]|nr:hypothetical protein PF1751_v1c24880 [Pseudomonas simiae]